MAKKMGITGTEVKPNIFSLLANFPMICIECVNKIHSSNTEGNAEHVRRWGTSDKKSGKKIENREKMRI